MLSTWRMYNAPLTKERTELIAAASVIIVSDTGSFPRVLLVHRSPALSLHGDLWAFPGGHVDPGDRMTNDDLEAARRCAVRETREETGLHVKAEDLVYMARWISPPTMPRRFDSWFFFAVGAYKNVHVDGREIIGHAWCPARQALLDHNRHARRLTPPAFVFLSRLADRGGLDAVCKSVQNSPVRYFRGLPVILPDGLCAVYEGDEAYRHKDLNRPGPRHRLWMRASEWKYENEF